MKYCKKCGDELDIIDGKEICPRCTESAKTVKAPKEAPKEAPKK